MKRIYTGKFQVGQTVIAGGMRRTVTEINRNRNGYPYRLNDGLYYPEQELSAEPPAQPAQTEAMDIDSGLGIGGINNDQTAPLVPSIAAIARVEQMHKTDTVCQRCGASAKFDGATFTTLGGSGICDDCA